MVGRRVRGLASTVGIERSSARVYGCAGRRRCRPPAGFDGAAEIHHRDVVGHFGDHAHVVGDQHDRQAALGLQVAQQVEDLRLGGDVQRRGRLIGDQDASGRTPAPWRS